MMKVIKPVFLRQTALLSSFLSSKNQKSPELDMRILLIEDDPKIASFVLKGLKEAGYAVDHAIDEG